MACAHTAHCAQPARLFVRAAGVGDKRVLRAALVRLGLPRAGARVKRAIQFGTRVAKLANCREFGSNRAANKASAGGVGLGQLRRGTPGAQQEQRPGDVVLN